MPVEAGARFGPYETLALLGAGGMGEVYRARDTRLGRTVALKVMSSTGIGTPTRLERFQREARAVSRLSHPHICTLHDVGEQDGVAFLVMEYLEGETLAERLEAGPLPLDQALRYGTQIAEALSVAHRQGVIHRDLKPGNVMVTRDGVKLLDFGLAKLTQDDGEGTTESLHLTDEGTLLGTVAYMAPEQLEGGPVDARTDIFALGAVLYEMAAGRRAFVGKSRASLIAAILSSEPPPLATHQPLTPPLLERVVRRCLAKDPEERWQSARDVASELRWILEGGSEAGVARSTAARRRARSMLWAGLAGAGLAAAAFAGFTALKEPRPLGPSFQQVTFRRGYVVSAGFAPDGETIVYSAAWDGQPHEVFSTRRGSTESRALGLKQARVASISRSGEMALIVGFSMGTLARAPLAGGGRRDLLEDVIDADWMPDGTDLAVVRIVRGSRPEFVVEFPIGRKVYASPTPITRIRVSPKGDRVALIAAIEKELFVLDRSGARTTLAKGLHQSSGVPTGLVWAPDGGEVWFTSTRSDPWEGPAALWAVSLSGRERLVAQAPVGYAVNDIRRDGAVLLGVNDSRAAMRCLPPGEAEERDLGWLTHSWVQALSSDGRTVLFAAGGAGRGRRGAAYIRKTDGSPAVRLAEGEPKALSPDGRWVLAAAPSLKEWFLLPTSAGMQRSLPPGPLGQIVSAAWADPSRLVLSGREAGRGVRVYVQDTEQGTIRPLTPEGFYLLLKPAVTPDGKAVLAQGQGRWSLIPIDGGDPRPAAFLELADIPLQWSTDGRVLYVARPRESTPTTTADVYRVDVATGRRDLFRTLSPPDPAGVEWIEGVALTPDGRSYCYTYSQTLGTLYVAQGLR